MQKLSQPPDDKVASTMDQAGFLCTYDAPGMDTPLFTHWTNTVVDFAYLRQEFSKEQSRSPMWSVKGVYVVPAVISDHLPVVHDLVFDPTEDRADTDTNKEQ